MPTRICLVCLFWLPVFLTPCPKRIDGCSRPVSNMDKLQMAGRGNCLPFEIKAIRTARAVDVADSRIEDLAFVNPSTLFAITAAGQVYLCDIDSATVQTVQELDPGTYRITAANQTGFLLIKLDVLAPEPKDLTRFDEGGSILWNVDDFDGGIPIYYQGHYLSEANLPSGKAGLISFSQTGEPIVLQQLDVRSSLTYLLIPTEQGLVWSGWFRGPFVTRVLDGHYATELFHPAWDEHAWKFIVDSDGVLYERYYGSDSLFVLDPRQPTGSVVSFSSELPSDEAASSDTWRYSEGLASDGQAVAILYGDTLLRYHEGEFAVWHDDLSSYSESDNPKALFLDQGGDHFLLPLRDRILLGNQTIEEIDIPGIRSTECMFSGDFHSMAFGTEDGCIVLMDIIPGAH